jgi:hypothetical protein
LWPTCREPLGSCQRWVVAGDGRPRPPAGVRSHRRQVRASSSSPAVPLTCHSEQS